MAVFIFPGQGSQKVGMAKELVDNFPKAKTFYEEASDSISMDLLKLCNEGPEEELRLTQNGQPAILTTSYAWFQIIQEEAGVKPEAGAGHSLGEYSALLCAGAMTLTEAVALVRKRGELMQSAVPVGQGSMAAIIGLDRSAVRELCQMATEDETSLVVPVNFNSPEQIVIAGHADAVDRAVKFASNPESTLKAKKAVLLNVSAPFHSPLMKPVRENFLPFLQRIGWQPLQYPIAFNVDAAFEEKPDLVAKLQAQIDSAVLWTDCVQLLASKVGKTFIEPGPSKVLTGLNRRIDRELKTHSVESIAGLKKLQGENQ